MITKYEKQLELLDEIYEICEHLKITCVLWGQSARNAYFGARLCNIAGDITLAMTGGDANRFIAYFYKSGKKDRYVEGLFNNPMHRKSGFLYGNMNTFRYKVKADRRKIHHGIDIKICLLEQLPNRKTKSGIKHIKRAKILMYREYEKRKAVKIVSNIAKVALNKPMNKYHISLLERVKIDRWEDLQDYERVGQGKFSYPGECFKGGVNSICVDDNHQFSIPANIEEILKIRFKDKWNVVEDKVNRDTANELLDTSIGYENIVSMPSFVQLMEEANRYREENRVVGKKKAKWAKVKRKYWRIINQVIEDLQ